MPAASATNGGTGHRYSRRLGIVEPVFTNLRSTHGLDRFSHRGRRKVTTQWQLFYLVHNIGKVHRYAKIQAGAKVNKPKVAA